MALAPTPPGPAGYPLLGVFPIARRDPLGFFLACTRRYGDVVSMRFGVHRAYLVRHPEHVKRVLQDAAPIYAKGSPASRVRALFGETLTVLDGDRWQRRRRRMQPAFQPGQHASFLAAATRAAGRMLERWQVSAARGEPVEVVGEMRRLTQTIIVEALFGEVPPAETRALGEALDLAVAGVERRLWSPLGCLVPPAAGATSRGAAGTVAAFVGRRVTEARRAGPPPGGIFAALLKARDEASGEPLPDDALAEECKALLVAGHTTTGSALAWTWCLLSEHPEARERIEQECRTVLGGRAPGRDDLPRLDVTRRVIEEVLRLYPPTWLTARTPLVDDALGGYLVPAGALLLLSPYLTHRHPAVWDEPERFDPDRFTGARAAGRPAFAYFPFGGGPRRCIGSAVATVEMQAVVATVAQRFRLDLLPGARTTPLAGLTLRPRGDIAMRLRPAPTQ